MKFSPLWTRTLFTAVSFYEIQKNKKQKNKQLLRVWLPIKASSSKTFLIRHGKPEVQKQQHPYVLSMIKDAKRRYPDTNPSRIIHVFCQACNKLPPV